MPAEQTDEHVRTCAACQVWRVRGSALTRSLRLRPAVEVPDLSAAILADAAVPAPGRGSWARAALVAVSVAQLGLGLTQLLGAGTTHPGHGAVGGATIASHLFNESTAWNLAVGVGLLWAALRPRAATGLIPVLAGFVVFLAAYSVHDLVTGAAPVARVAGHGVLVAGLVLVVVVHRRLRGPAPEGTSTVVREHAGHTSADDPVTGSRVTGTTRRSHLLPVGRHRRAA